MTHTWTFWTKSLLGASLGFSTLIWASTGLGQLPVVPPVPVPDVAPAVEPAKDIVKDAADTAKEATKDAADTAKDAAKDATDTAKDAVKNVRDAAQPVPGAVRDAARDAREGVRDTTRDVREGARDTVRDAREGVRDTARDVRDGARDSVRDARDAARDTVRDVRDTVRGSASARASLRWQDLQSADVGLWFDRNANDGLIISDISAQGPIAELGFQEGDRIVSVNGQRVARQADFTRFLFSANVKGRVPVIVTRGGQQVTINMEPQVFLTHVNSYQSDPLEQIGIVADDRMEGKAVVWKVVPRSPAYFAGLRSGDVIISFNKQPVTAYAELTQLAAKVKPGPIALEVQRGDRARELEVDFQASQSEVRSSLRPDYDSEAPVLEGSVRTPAASGYYNSGNNSGRRGLFRGRR